MKRSILFVLAVALTCPLAACGRSEGQPSSAAEASGLHKNMEDGRGDKQKNDSGAGENLEGEGEPEIAGNPESTENAGLTGYIVGDIILADGSAVKSEELMEMDSRNCPIAIIAGYRADGVALGVGIYRSDAPLQWAADGSVGYATGFAENVCVQDSDTSFVGDQDGSDNWEVICLQDKSGTGDAAENYPAFHFINTYGEAHGLTGAYALDWYMPSISELCLIYENRETINASLHRIHELDDSGMMDGLGTNWYWASSQSGSEEDYAWFVHYFNGYAGECPKNFTNVDVLAVRAF